MSDKFKLIWLDDTYINIKTELNLQDYIGYRYSMTLDNLLSSYENNMELNPFSSCNKHTIYNIKLWMKIQNKTDELLSDQYINNIKKLVFKCKNGHKFKVGWNAYQSGTGCSDCAGNTKKTFEEMKNIIETKFRQDDKLIVLDHDIQNTHSKINLIDKYGFKYYMSYISILTGINQNANLRKIGKENPYSIDNIKLIMKESAVGYALFSNRYSVKKKLLFKCNENHDFKMTWNDFSQGYRCPVCNESHGEQRVRNYLLLKNLIFEPQFKFKDCKHKNSLPFDYAVFDNNINIKYLIEYQGKQHYEPIDWFGGTKAFLNQQIRDNIKREYCKINNINLIEIPYWDFNNIEDILYKFLLKVS